MTKSELAAQLRRRQLDRGLVPQCMVDMLLTAPLSILT